MAGCAWYDVVCHGSEVAGKVLGWSGRAVGHAATALGSAISWVQQHPGPTLVIIGTWLTAATAIVACVGICAPAVLGPVIALTVAAASATTVGTVLWAGERATNSASFSSNLALEMVAYLKGKPGEIVNGLLWDVYCDISRAITGYCVPPYITI